MSRSLGKAEGDAADFHRRRDFAAPLSSVQADIAIDREAPTLLLAALTERSYNTEIASGQSGEHSYGQI